MEGGKEEEEKEEKKDRVTEGSFIHSGYFYSASSSHYYSEAL